jgi:hypothetical protein
MYLVDVGHLEPVAAGMEVLLDGVQGALQHSALLGGQAALTLLRDVLTEKQKHFYKTVFICISS